MTVILHIFVFLFTFSNVLLQIKPLLQQFGLCLVVQCVILSMKLTVLSICVGVLRV